MGRLSIDKLPEPTPEARAEVTSGLFNRLESIGFSEAEDAKRVKLLRKTGAQRTGKRIGNMAKRLANRLDWGALGKNPPVTLASSRHFRSVRVRLVSALIKLARDPRWPNPSVFHIVPKHWEFEAKHLGAFNPKKRLAAFRSDLNRCGAGSADGYLIAFIHGEYEPEKGIFRMHLHGLVEGGMKDVLEKLKKRKRYKSVRKGLSTGVGL